MFDLEEDPHERVDLHEEEARRFEGMQRRAQALWRSFPLRFARSAAATTSTDEQDLRALGYMGEDDH